MIHSGACTVYSSSSAKRCCNSSRRAAGFPSTSCSPSFGSGWIHGAADFLPLHDMLNDSMQCIASGIGCHLQMYRKQMPQKNRREDVISRFASSSEPTVAKTPHPVSSSCSLYCQTSGALFLGVRSKPMVCRTYPLAVKIPVTLILFLMLLHHI